MYNTSFIKKILLIATVVLLYSCDKDFNAIGEGLIGDDHFGLESEKYDVLAYNQEVTPVQSNGLTLTGLGIYDNAVFGTNTSNFVSQVTLATDAPTIGEAPVIESVVLSIPYFINSSATTADPKGGNIYKLDSIYGDPKGKIKLSVYESGVQMRSSYFEGGSQFNQLYYTNQDSGADAINFDTSKIGARLNDDPDPAQNDAFFFSAAQRKDSTVVDANAAVKTYTYTYIAPEMHLNLNKAFFLEKILKAPASKLSSATIFQEYFRGLYFKAERSEGSPSNLALLDIAKSGNAKITIKYKAKTAITTDPDETMEDKTLVINLSGAQASLYQDNKNPTYYNAVTNPNKTVGDDRLYLKGGQGSLAVLDLTGFGAKLADIRTKNWLVNEANLVFSIDTDKMAGTYEPKRVYLYDLDNSLPILDYSSDATTATTNPPGKVVYSGIINIDPTSKRGTTYKIRLTNHIRNIIKNATVKNVKLGLVVTGDIGTITFGQLKLKNDIFSNVPRASIMSPLGTVLYGGTSSSNVPAGKKLQLEIYYTKPN
ncbi:DUF4270 domain-containing protein [Flavobacterium aquidurense]|uniref:DUF4270 domain-containing protein n=1 Tax=Flavobacterium aquidurense TaxID=362413 RepID=UPI000916BA8A|nr:DUF4270 domain-containing protein [Flavobacterium aquidurense]OXA72491.1 hypothetical protein B0A67_08085 [Flavobacterium aquidurense]SHG39853.1 protein of unknown function [Flavobacterium frigidimaris]